MLAWPEGGYERETTGFPLKLEEDAADERYQGKAKADIPFQLICSPSETQARGSWNLVQNTGSWVFSTKAKRSMFGFSISAFSIWRASGRQR